MTEIAARRSSGRLLRRRYSEHNPRRMEKHRSLQRVPGAGRYSRSQPK